MIPPPTTTASKDAADEDDEDDDDEDEDDTGTCTRLSTIARVDRLLIGIIGGEGGDDVSSFS